MHIQASAKHGFAITKKGMETARGTIFWIAQSLDHSDVEQEMTKLQASGKKV